jgi:hypothetical protein
MSMFSHNKTQKAQSRYFRFQDFEVSWAGTHPLIEGYCLGSEDGRFKLISTTGSEMRTAQLVDSGEAINGIAFSGNVIAASTRCEVVFHNPNPIAESDGSGFYPYDGGAHGVLATSAGGFVAPLGTGGLLRAPMVDGQLHPVANMIRDKEVDLYKLVSLYGDGERDVIAAASRRDGIFTFDLVSSVNDGRPNSGPYYKAPELDVVDLCSFDSPNWPFAIAALGADGSLHLFHDIMGKQQPISFRLNGLIGAFYAILHSQGHVFVLTSKAFYTFPNLASQFLGASIGDEILDIRVEYLSAVDAYIARDEILIVMADGVRVESIASLASGTNSASVAFNGNARPKSAKFQFDKLPYVINEKDAA